VQAEIISMLFFLLSGKIDSIFVTYVLQFATALFVSTGMKRNNEVGRKVSALGSTFERG
jgi:hypothetical protein